MMGEGGEDKSGMGVGGVDVMGSRGGLEGMEGESRKTG